GLIESGSAGLSVQYPQLQAGLPLEMIFFQVEDYVHFPLGQKGEGPGHAESNSRCRKPLPGTEHQFQVLVPDYPAHPLVITKMAAKKYWPGVPGAEWLHAGQELVEALADIPKVDFRINANPRVPLFWP